MPRFPVNIGMVPNLETDLAVGVKIRAAERRVWLESLSIVRIVADGVFHFRALVQLVSDLGTSFASAPSDRFHPCFFHLRDSRELDGIGAEEALKHLFGDDFWISSEIRFHEVASSPKELINILA